MAKYEEKNIVDFWHNMHLYNTPESLKSAAFEYYSDDFINNYDKWANNLVELNETIRAHMESHSFPMRYWEEMSYDWFCTRVNESIAAHITKFGTIAPEDVHDITEQLIADYICIIDAKYAAHAYTITALLDSIKRPFIM